MEMSDTAETMRAPRSCTESNRSARVPAEPRERAREGAEEDVNLTTSFKEIRDILRTKKAKRDTIQRCTNALDQSLKEIQHAVATGKLAAARDGVRRVAETISTVLIPSIEGDAYLRRAPFISSVIGKYACAVFLQTFFTCGKLVIPATDKLRRDVSDEEYVSGAISAANAMKRYAILRATDRDARSVSICADIVKRLQVELLEFDFRNGPLRRQYDSLKYVVRHMENIIYELSMLNEITETMDESSKEQDGDLVDVQTLRSIAARMAVYDARREDTIKKSRDVLKNAKKAVFATHRGKPKQAEQLLKKSADVAKDIVETVLKNEPCLRRGSYANALEEWAEARLFQHWIKVGGKSRDCILSMAEMSNDIELSPDEYLGGLVDLTGEIGRWAVARAAERDAHAVTHALMTCLRIQDLTLSLGDVAPHKLTKKFNDVNRNVSKLEKVLYDLTLVKGTGRKNVSSETGKSHPKGDEHSDE